MRISHRYRFIFFSNPKTGSASVRDLLLPYSDVFDKPYRETSPAHPFYSHIRPDDVRTAFRRFKWPFNDYYRFVFVRNPWTRLVSLYEMRRRLDPKFSETFADWLTASRTDGPGGGGPDDARWLKYGTYSLAAFAGDRRGRLLVDDVFRMEDMAGVPERLRSRGILVPAGVTVPRKNTTDAGSRVDRYYTADLIALVGERYAAEIATYGYAYPG